MSVVSFRDLGKAFGDLDVFTGLSGEVPRGARIGLVGPNGVGKTTLMRVLVGLEAPSSGTVQRARGTRVGILEQEAADAFITPEHSVTTEMLAVFAELRAREAAMRRMEAAMADGDDSEALMTRYGAAQETFARDGGYEYELRIQQVLTGLGFKDEQQHMPLAHCSGGQKTRALLARLLLERPDLLVLDEPTNHLDIEAVAWLESTLARWDGALLIVSHDRYFLDQVANVIWEMRGQGMETYRGNYSAYVTQREERWAWRAREYATVYERFLKELDFIKRFMPSGDPQAKGRLKRLAREVQAVALGGTQALNQKWSDFMDDGPAISKRTWDVPEIEQAIKALRAPDASFDRFHLRLRAAQRGGNEVLRAHDVVIGYPGTPLFEIDELLLQRGQCAALIGANGTGKSTFLRTLLGELVPLRGELTLGANLEVRYFAQAYEVLDPEQRVIDELLSHQPMGLGEARSLLARYLFRGDDVYKPMRALSGGERGRFALAILALHPVNLLLLDEPTNHLDIEAQEMLEGTLIDYQGTVLMVSHDRYLISRLATQIWELRDGRLHIYPGGYAAYLTARQAEQSAATEARAEAARQVATTSQPANAAARRRPESEDVEILVAAIHAQEMRLADLAQAMIDATQAQDWAQVQALDQAYRDHEAQLARLMARWERAEVGVA
jgi:ATP-binding cassette, subfamily F, member 3